MDETALVKIFRRLCQGSKESVQSGLELDEFDNYMHVERPIDKAVRDTMDEIRVEGGGILFLVGSAGDGKSHMISRSILILSLGTMLLKVLGQMLNPLML
mgnify:CR=1 FL=1